MSARKQMSRTSYIYTGYCKKPRPICCGSNGNSNRIERVAEQTAGIAGDGLVNSVMQICRKSGGAAFRVNAENTRKRQTEFDKTALRSNRILVGDNGLPVVETESDG